MVITFYFALPSFAEAGNVNQVDMTQTKMTTTIINKRTDEVSKSSDNLAEADEPEEYEEVINYPKTGSKPADFLPKSHAYEIQYETKGDLNNDGLEDIVLVLKNKEIPIANRPMLVLLKNKNKSYHLDKFSQETFPAEYNEHDFKLYDQEDITIENGELQIDLYSLTSNYSYSFKYTAKDLILTFSEAFFRGAGGHSGIVHDFRKGEITITETNTMEEDMPTTSETTKEKMKQYLFEDFSISRFFEE